MSNIDVGEGFKLVRGTIEYAPGPYVEKFSAYNLFYSNMTIGDENISITSISSRNIWRPYEEVRQDDN